MKISVLVKTGSKIEYVKKIGAVYEVRVKARPIEGQANQEVIKLLSEHLKISKSSIRIKSGLKSKKKIIEVLQ